VAYTIHITELCLQFATSSEQEMEMSIDPLLQLQSRKVVMLELG